MFPQPKTSGYTTGLNRVLLEAVPDTAIVVVETGCAEGLLGAELKARVPGRTVIGIEIDEDSAVEARTRLDEVHVHDLMTGPPPIEPGSVDAVLFGDVLEHVVDPEAVLVGVRDLLAPGGRVLASIPNVGHHSLLRPLLRGDFMYQPQGQLDATHLRFFTYATIFKLFLDAGYVPRIVAIAEGPISDALHTALTPALVHNRVDPGRARKHLGAFQYIVEGRPEPDRPDGFAAPMTFACLVNDRAQLDSNLLRSPIFAPGSPHELIELPGCTSAAEGLLKAREQAQHDVVVLVQQDIYLPRGWDHVFVDSWERAKAEFGEIGVAGLYGLRYRDGQPRTSAGRVIDRDQLLDESTPLPATVDCLDEIVLAMPRNSPLVPDPQLGFHLYGADLALQAKELGLPVVVLEGVCLHNSLFSRLDAAFDASRRYLLDKWSGKRPLWTSLGELDAMRLPPASVPWHTQLRKDLASAQRTIAERDKQLAAARKQLQGADTRLKNMQATRTWRARSALVRGVRKVARNRQP